MNRYNITSIIKFRIIDFYIDIAILANLIISRVNFFVNVVILQRTKTIKILMIIYPRIFTVSYISLDISTQSLNHKVKGFIIRIYKSIKFPFMAINIIRESKP